MKKLIILLLTAVIVVLPFTSLYGEEITLFDRYKENDISLNELEEKYEELTEEREYKINLYENFRINRRNIYYTAVSYAAKENGLLQVDWDINNSFYNMKAREAFLEISFRNSLISLNNKTNASDLAFQTKAAALEQYNETASNNSKGYASNVELLEAEYNYKKADNAYLSSSRSMNSEIRAFDRLLGDALDLDDLTFDFSEELLEPINLSEYIDLALSYSPSIVLTMQSITRYENELKYLNKYVISDSLSYYRDKRESVEINLAISRLTLEKNKLNLIQKIEDQYNILIIEKEKIGLAKLSLEIAETNHEINKNLYYRKLIDYSEFIESEQSVETALKEYETAVYKCNTMLKELEYDCACFMPEDK